VKYNQLNRRELIINTYIVIIRLTFYNHKKLMKKIKADIAFLKLENKRIQEDLEAITTLLKIHKPPEVSVD
jgi:hypothetical protein